MVQLFMSSGNYDQPPSFKSDAHLRYGVRLLVKGFTEYL